MTGANQTGHLRYDVLRASLMNTCRILPNVPIFVFHEDYTQEDILGFPHGITFEKVDFRGFETIYNSSLPSPRGYLMMCRFFSGVVQQHPLLQKYSHYIRLDDDSYFLEPYITESAIQQFCQHDYVFRALFHEAKPQQSLYEFTMRFIDSKLNVVQKLQLKRLLVSHGVITRTDQYTGLAPYNNFHLSSFRLWRHPIVREYINAIEGSGGIFRNGWLDANIHAMILFIFRFLIPEISIQSSTIFGYRHNQHMCSLYNLDVVYDKTISFYPLWLNTTILPEERDAPDVSISYPGSLTCVAFANTSYMPLDRFKTHAKNLNVFDDIRTYSELDFPNFFNEHASFVQENRLIGYGRWIWKPMVILETLLTLKPNDILVYADGGVHLNKRGLPRFKEYVDMLKDPSKTIVSFATHFTHTNYVDDRAIESYFPEFRYEDYRYHYAGIMLIKHSDVSLQMVREWLKLCENYVYLSHHGGDGDNGLYNLCVSKYLSNVVSVYPDEVKPANDDWSSLVSFPFHCRRIRPVR
jgi:hypothetical protein